MNDSTINKKAIHPLPKQAIQGSKPEMRDQIAVFAENTRTQRIDTLETPEKETALGDNKNQGRKIKKPSVQQSKAPHADARSSFVSSFFNKSYKSPGFSETLALQRDRSFQAKLPFLFVVRKDENDASGSLIDAFPCATFYDKLDADDARDSLGNTQVYMLKPGVSDVEEIGTINDIEDVKNPLGFHLLLLNNDQFAIGDPENLRGETLAAASVLFRTGTCVVKDEPIAESLLSLIPAENRDFHFGRAMIDALLEEDYVSAEACLSYGGQLQSVDDHGHLAISCALRPGAEDFLEKMLVQTAKPEDLAILRAEYEDHGGDLSNQIRAILKQHIDRLSVVGAG